MLQDIAPHIYDISFQAPAPSPHDHLLCYSAQGVLVQDGEELDFPLCGGHDAACLRFLFTIDSENYFLSTEEVATPSGCRWCALSEMREVKPQWRAYAAMTGSHLWRWYRNHRFCGCCGQEMTLSTQERALVCPSCGQTVYPTIAPALIVAVTDGDRLLLTRYADRPYKRWALIAGFNEVGESLEATLTRELREEVGLTVCNPRYYKSQPWPFSDSLLMGFFCDVVGDPTPRPDGQELAEAHWFHRDELPTDDRPAISLTQEMIQLFKEGKEPR